MKLSRMPLSLMLLASFSCSLGVSMAQQPTTPASSDVPVTHDLSEVRSGAYVLDHHHGRVHWSVSHHGFSTFTAIFPVIDATLQFDADDVTRSELEAVVRMQDVSSSIDAFDERLNGDAWFDTEQFPTSTFRSTKISDVGDSKLRVVGDLTFMGVTKPLTLKVSFAQAGDLGTPGGYRVGFDASAVMQRSNWGMPKSTVGDEVALDIEAEFLVPNEALSEVEENKAVAAAFLDVKGTPKYRAKAQEVLAGDHKRTRREFENLFYNADDPKLSKESDPDYVAITDRTNEVTRILGQGDLVAATYKMSGKHTGNLYGIPATNKEVELEGVAIFRLAEGKIVESWYMLEEARLLRELNVRLPSRVDGKLNLPPVVDNTRTYDVALAEHLANPNDTPEWRHTKLLLSYKSKPENRPADYQFEGRPYSNLQRGGIDIIKYRAEALGLEGGHGQSMSGRRDMVAEVIADGDLAMMRFRLTALNDGPLYGIPAGGKPLNDWEFGFGRFEGDTWVDAWWMKDELGFLLSIGNQEALDFLIDEK